MSDLQGFISYIMKKNIPALPKQNTKYKKRDKEQALFMLYDNVYTEFNQCCKDNMLTEEDLTTLIHHLRKYTHNQKYAMNFLSGEQEVRIRLTSKKLTSKHLEKLDDMLMDIILRHSKKKNIKQRN